jgi:hypothetical protein
VMKAVVVKPVAEKKASAVNASLSNPRSSRPQARCLLPPQHLHPCPKLRPLLCRFPCPSPLPPLRKPSQPLRLLHRSASRQSRHQRRLLRPHPRLWQLHRHNPVSPRARKTS